jgi:hypothetical protein
MEYYTDVMLSYERATESLPDEAATEYEALQIDREKKKTLNAYKAAARIKKFMAWCSSISVDEKQSGKTVLIEHKPDIVDTLGSFDSAYENLSDGLAAYQNSSLVGLTGFKSYTCPSCNTVQGTKLNNEIVPISMLGFFSVIIKRRVMKNYLPNI